MKYKHIHFVGIKGVGMTPLAIIAKEAGIVVSGSDIDYEFITDSPLKKAKIISYSNFSKEHVGNADLIITTGAHGGYDNVEVREAKKREIKVITQGEAVGVFMHGDILGRKFEGISIAGTHGKTTVSALLATVLNNNGLDPSYVIGTSYIPSLPSPGHFGKGKYFVAEADEYASDLTYDRTPKLLWQRPRIALITNIELDHPDFYSNVDEIKEVFKKFIFQLPEDGLLVLNGDDSQLSIFRKEYKGRVLTFGSSKVNDLVVERISISNNQTFFWPVLNDMPLGEFLIKIPGRHNVMNALGAFLIARECGIQPEQIKKSFLKYTGSKRRFEYIGKTKSGALLYDDYAHHPTEVEKTLEAFKLSFPNHKIVCIFQPHTYSRTKKLFDQFLHSFKHANSIIITNIYSSAREELDASITSEMLVNSLKRLTQNVLFLPEPADVVEYIQKKEFGENTLIVTMGAGDIYKVSQKLIWKNLL